MPESCLKSSRLDERIRRPAGSRPWLTEPVGYELTASQTAFAERKKNDIAPKQKYSRALGSLSAHFHGGVVYPRRPCLLPNVAVQGRGLPCIGSTQDTALVRPIGAEKSVEPGVAQPRSAALVWSRPSAGREASSRPAHHALTTANLPQMKSRRLAILAHPKDSLSATSPALSHLVPI
jgi:hypothetical protein